MDSSGALTWNTFLGGTGFDSGESVAVDSSGNVYLTGTSNATWGSPVNPYSASDDAFVAKLNSSGALTWNTFLGGTGNDSSFSVAVDSSGNVYLAGHSNATWGSPVNPYSAATDTFAAKLNNSGVYQWHTFLGGTGNDFSISVAVDSNGNVYVVGYTSTPWGSPLNAHSGNFDTFAAKWGIPMAHLLGWGGG